jgi:hypothetical protein
MMAMIPAEKASKSVAERKRMKAVVRRVDNVGPAQFK